MLQLMNSLKNLFRSKTPVSENKTQDKIRDKTNIQTKDAARILLQTDDMISSLDLMSINASQKVIRADQKNTPKEPLKTPIFQSYNAKTNETAKTMNKDQIDQFILILNQQAEQKSTAHCATYVRKAIQKTIHSNNIGHPRSAKDYAPCLLKLGFNKQEKTTGYVPQKGDIVVFQASSKSNNGHIQVYNGQTWVSDFLQHNKDIYPGPSYREEKIAYEIFRL